MTISTCLEDELEHCTRVPAGMLDYIYMPSLLDNSICPIFETISGGGAKVLGFRVYGLALYLEGYSLSREWRQIYMPDLRDYIWGWS